MRAVIFGAGKIGRGFLGELVYRSGGEITFVDAYAPLAEALNRAGKYPLLLTGKNGWERKEISGFTALSTAEAEKIADAVAGADIVFTAVGLANLPAIAPLLSTGICLRKAPLNILVCENGMEAVPVLKEAVLSLCPKDAHVSIGFAEVSVGRMVPMPPKNLAEEEPLLVAAEPYYHLPVNADSLVCPLPAVQGIEAVAPFALVLEQKLYLQNMSHAVCAYLGDRLGYATIWEAVGDRNIRILTASAMNDVARSLAKRHGVEEAPLLALTEEMLTRYDNRLLGDTVARVGRDTPRKLAPTDRLCGALSACMPEGSAALEAAIAAAFLFEMDDASAVPARFAAENGIRSALTHFCGITNEGLISTIAEDYNALRTSPADAVRRLAGICNN